MTTEPYYQDEWVTLYHGDAEDLTLTLQADVAITDPPYGFGSYASDKEAPAVVLHTLLQCRTAAIFGYPELLVRWCRIIERNPDEWVTWWPTNAKTRAYGSALARESEHIAIFGPSHGERIMRSRSNSSFGKRRAAQRGLDTESCRDGDVWRTPADGVGTNGHLRVHPNQKPLSLMRRLLVLCSDVGDLILDPFAGSGTTLVAAKLDGRHSVGVEIEERYCEIAARRLSQDVLDFATSGVLEDA